MGPSGKWYAAARVTRGTVLRRGGMGAGLAGKGCGLMKKCRCRLLISTAATATMPPPSSHLSANRSAAGTPISSSASLWGRVAAACRSARSRRSVITSSTPSTTSSAIPIATPSARSGPFHRGAGTTPRRPTMASTTSSASGSRRASCCLAIMKSGSRTHSVLSAQNPTGHQRADVMCRTPRE